MQSFRSRLVIWLIRNRHILNLKFKREIVDATFSVNEFRKKIDKASAGIKLPQYISSQIITAEGINAEWISPDNVPEDKVLLYIHGGGFISGSCLTHRMHVAKFAKGCGLRSLVFDYRLAPEHPFPAALDDCVTVYKWLLNEGYQPDKIVIGGESAGATLVLSLLLALKKSSITLPKAAFSISPVTDLRCQADSFVYNAKNDVAPYGSWSVWTNYYMADNDPGEPLLSPAFGDFRGIPPIYICVGTNEIHYDDCISISKIAEESGVDVTLRVWHKMIHAFPLLSPLFPEAKSAMREICDYVRRELLLP